MLKTSPLMPPTARPKTVFFGSPDFAVPSLDRVAADTDLVAVVSQPDRPAGRGQELSAPAVKRRAQSLRANLPILQPEKIRTPEFERELRAFEADLFIVVAYGRILPPALLAIPRRGPWNVHASLLPSLRGAAPIQWSVINGDAEAGVSIMRMEEGLDTGPVVTSQATPIGDTETAGDLSLRLSHLGAELLGSVLPQLASGSAALSPQDESRFTLAPLLRKEDGRLDFSKPARVVSARARGVDPWPGASAILDDQVVKLFRPRCEPSGKGTDQPSGTVLAIDEGGVHVACGEGVIAFAEVQLPGKKRLPASVVASGRALAVGVRFV